METSTLRLGVHLSDAQPEPTRGLVCAQILDYKKLEDELRRTGAMIPAPPAKNGAERENVDAQLTYSILSVLEAFTPSSRVLIRMPDVVTLC